MKRNAAEKVVKYLRESPKNIGRAIDDFGANARAFSMSKEEALEKYENKWIAIYDGGVAAVADSLDALAHRVEEMKIPASQAIFRRIDRKEKVLIL